MAIRWWCVRWHGQFVVVVRYKGTILHGEILCVERCGTGVVGEANDFIFLLD